MNFTLSINLENDAFQGRATDEIAHILRAVADYLERSQDGEHNTIRDSNGNACGSFGFTLSNPDGMA